MVATNLLTVVLCLAFFGDQAGGYRFTVNRWCKTRSTKKTTTDVFSPEKWVEDDLANGNLPKWGPKCSKKVPSGEFSVRFFDFKIGSSHQVPLTTEMSSFDMQVTLSWSFLGSAFSTLSGIWLLNQFSPGSKESSRSSDSFGRSTNLQ